MPQVHPEPELPERAPALLEPGRALQPLVPEPEARLRSVPERLPQSGLEPGLSRQGLH